MSTRTFPHPAVLTATVRPHQGRWHVTVGNEVRRTYSGTDAQRHATDLALALNDPALARLVASFLKLCPTLWKTAHRAADLLLRHHLTAPLRTPGKPRRQGTELATVRSGTRSDTRYTLRQDAYGTLACTCPSYCEQPFYGPAGKPFCKHLLAYIFQQKLARPLPPAPTPAHLWDTLSSTLKTHLHPATWHKLFADATLSSRSTLTKLSISVPDKAVATLLSHPQWQDALHRTLTNLCGYPVNIRITVRRATRTAPVKPQLSLVSATPSGRPQAAPRVA